MTSMKAFLGHEVDLDAVKNHIIENFETLFEVQLVETGPEEVLAVPAR
jgi:hypothetical protein